MHLTTQDLTRFVGGQMEVQNRNEGYVYRGEVQSITVEDNKLKVKFAWIARLSEGNKWVKDDRVDYAASLEVYEATNIGPSGPDIGGDNRLCLMAPIIGEIVVLYPPNGSKLDPAKVEGLHVA